MRYYVDLGSMNYGKNYTFGDLIRARDTELCTKQEVVQTETQPRHDRPIHRIVGAS